jgi:hypothetical protein
MAMGSGSTPGHSSDRRHAGAAPICDLLEATAQSQHREPDLHTNLLRPALYASQRRRSQFRSCGSQGRAAGASRFAWQGLPPCGRGRRCVHRQSSQWREFLTCRLARSGSRRCLPPGCQLDGGQAHRSGFHRGRCHCHNGCPRRHRHSDWMVIHFVTFGLPSQLTTAFPCESASDQPRCKATHRAVSAS